MKRFSNPKFDIFVFYSLVIHLSFLAFLAFKPGSTIVLDQPKSTPMMVTLLKPQKVKKFKKIIQIVEQDKNPDQKLNTNAKFLSENDNAPVKETQAEDAGVFSNDKNSMEPLKTFSGDVRVPAAKRSKTSDYLMDIQKGAQTLLATKATVSFQYHIKIRNAVHAHWAEQIQSRKEDLRQEQEQLARPTSEKKTKLFFSLSNLGELLDIRIVSGSGLPSADQIAVEAFRSSQPFSPPPVELLDTNGQFSMQWDFIIENNI